MTICGNREGRWVGSQNNDRRHFALFFAGQQQKNKHTLIKQINYKNQNFQNLNDHKTTKVFVCRMASGAAPVCFFVANTCRRDRASDEARRRWAVPKGTPGARSAAARHASHILGWLHGSAWRVWDCVVAWDAVPEPWQSGKVTELDAPDNLIPTCSAETLWPSR